MIFHAVVLAMISLASCAGADKVGTGHTYYDPDSTNLIGPGTDFDLLCNTSEDTTRKAIRFGPYDAGCNPKYVSSKLSVTSGTRYYCRVTLYGERIGQSVDLLVSGRNAESVSLRNYFGGLYYIPEKTWHTIEMSYVPDDDVAYAQPVLLRHRYAMSKGEVWARDFYFGTEPLKRRPKREPFEGASVSIDTLGNWLLDDGPFFIIGINPAWSRSDWSIYKKQGFNTIVRDPFRWGHKFKKSFEAGMFRIYDIDTFIAMARDSVSTAAAADSLQNVLERMMRHRFPDGSNAFSSLISFYWDNEHANLTPSYTALAEIVATIRRVDPEHPIYILNGTPGVSPVYRDLADVTGTYLTFTGQGHTTETIRTLNTLSTVPVSIMQINDSKEHSLTAREFRLAVYVGLVHGGKGIHLWRDHEDPERRVEFSLWWNELPEVAKEIKEWLPVLRLPMVQGITHPLLEIGTRQDADGTLYLIIVNSGEDKVETTLPGHYRTLSGSSLPSDGANTTITLEAARALVLEKTTLE
jgi:hypothetical protein